MYAIKHLFCVWDCCDGMKFACESGSFLSSMVWYSVLLGCDPWRWKHYILSMCLEPVTEWHCITSQKNESWNLYIYCNNCYLKIMLVIIYCHFLQLHIWLHCLSCARASFIWRTAWNMNWTSMDILSNQNFASYIYIFSVFKIVLDKI